MNWRDEELQVAALRLLLNGQTKKSQASSALLDQLDEIGVITPTRRRDQFEVVAGRETDLRKYLSTRWPEYAQAESVFRHQPGAPDAAQLRALRRKHLESPTSFQQLHHKTWSAWNGAHSKSGEFSSPAGLKLTTDDIVRMRVNTGIRIKKTDDTELDLGAWQQLTSEAIVSERAFADEWSFCGTMPRVILTVENLGSFVDITKPPGCMLIHSPGWNTTLATRLVAKLPTDIPWWHFGDLDPNGLKIGMSLGIEGNQARKPSIWIPHAAQQLLESHSLKRDQPWPVNAIPNYLLANESIAWLVHHGRWMEHEAIVLLPEFAVELANL